MNRVKRLIPLLLLSAVLLTAAWIVRNSLESGDESNARSEAFSTAVQPMLDREKQIPPKRFHVLLRKSAHLLEYALLGAESMALLLSYVWPRGKKAFSCLSLPLLWLLLVAVIDEYLQTFSHRTSSLKDVWLDFGGAALGLLALWGIGTALRLCVKGKKKRQNLKVSLDFNKREE